MNYKVYECEEIMTSTGKALKKLVLQGEGKQYPDKNVTMWADHPLYEDTVAGQTIDVELDVKDSTTPNPKGGFYKNKTVKKDNTPTPLKRADQGPAASNAATQELKNILTLQIMPLLQGISKDIVTITEKMKMKEPYPEMDETNDASGITQDDSPF